MCGRDPHRRRLRRDAPRQSLRHAEQKARIFLRREDLCKHVEFDELKVGPPVEARFTGVVAPTDPVHAMASEIVILQ